MVLQRRSARREEIDTFGALWGRTVELALRVDERADSRHL
jgi:hypothetical protein